MSQRKKIYSSKWANKLQSDPIVVEIDGEVLKFRYQNALKDLPNTRKSLRAAIEQFETDADFANLKPLLEGIAHTGRKLPPSFYTKIIRVAGVKGHIYTVIDCARSVRRTAYKLDSSEKANEILQFVQMKACDAAWAEEETKQALRWAEMVVEMLEDEKHQPKRPKNDSPLPGELPLNRDPMVLAAPLHLAAVLAARHGAGEEVIEKVNKLATDVVALWPEGKSLRRLQPEPLYEDPDKLGYLNVPNTYLALVVPILHGLEAAIEVVGPELGASLRSRRDMLAEEIKQLREEVAATPRPGNKTLIAAQEAGEGTDVSVELAKGEKVWQSIYGPLVVNEEVQP